jgi:hypothetical protein
LYTIARARREAEEYTFKIYVTDTLKCLAKADKRWCDLVRPKKAEEVDADAIVQSIIAGAELEVI